MSYTIDRYKEESRKLDTTGVEWDRIRDHPLSKGDLFFVHYPMVLQDLMARIQKDERRHFAFYYNSAREWMTDNPRGQLVARVGLRYFWRVVGDGLKSKEEVDAVSLYLFGDEEGKADVETIDEKI